jgi:hypothetical protein
MTEETLTLAQRVRTYAAVGRPVVIELTPQDARSVAQALEVLDARRAPDCLKPDIEPSSRPAVNEPGIMRTAWVHDLEREAPDLLNFLIRVGCAGVLIALCNIWGALL